MSEQPAEMTGSQYAVIMQRGHTPSLDEFKRMEIYDRNTFWRLSAGDHQNLLDEALTENASLRGKLADIHELADRMRDENGQSWNSISGQRIHNVLNREESNDD